MTNLKKIISALEDIQKELSNIPKKDIRDIALHSSRALFTSEVVEHIDECANDVGGIVYDLKKLL